MTQPPTFRGLAPDRYLYALGAVSLGFNRLESHLLYYIQMISADPFSISAYHFSKHDIGTNVQLLRKLVGERSPGAHSNNVLIRQLANDFCDGFDACSENRHLLVHSQVEYRRALGPGTIAKKLNKRGEENFYDFTADVVERVATEIDAWDEFGRDGLLWLIAVIAPHVSPSPVPPLPDKPSVPERIGTPLNTAQQEA